MRPMANVRRAVSFRLVSQPSEFIMKLGYLKDSNAAAHSVDNDIFYVVIDLSARSKSYIITFISLSRVKSWCVT